MKGLSPVPKDSFRCFNVPSLSLYHANQLVCAESLASQNASRLAAMQRADKNIDESLEDLNGKFHRLRQSGIDEELFDVISGFEALSAKEDLKVQLTAPLKAAAKAKQGKTGLRRSGRFGKMNSIINRREQRGGN